MTTRVRRASTSAFEIIPAIDLRAGRCVRLFQGDFERETVFGHDPVGMARHWQDLGATRLHVVDLDGARKGAPTQLHVIEKIARGVRVPIQLGGGLRSLEHIRAAVTAGVDRLVLGTAAIAGEAALAFRTSALQEYCDRVVIGLDAKDSRLAVQGWTKATQEDAVAFAQRLRDEGFGRIIYTDIQRDGALSGPNFAHVERLTQIEGLAVIGSGGVSSIADLVGLKGVGAEGAIVGQALYTGAVKLPESLKQLAEISPSTRRRC